MLLNSTPITINWRELTSINFTLTSPADFPEPFEICTMLPVTLQELGIESDAVLDFFTATVNQVSVSDLESTEFPPGSTSLPDVCPTNEAPNGAVILTLPTGLNGGDELEVVLTVPPVP